MCGEEHQIPKPMMGSEGRGKGLGGRASPRHNCGGNGMVSGTPESPLPCLNWALPGAVLSPLPYTQDNHLSLASTPSTHPTIPLSIHPSPYAPSIHPSIHPATCPCICPSIYPSVHPPIHPSSLPGFTPPFLHAIDKELLITKDGPGTI